VFGASSVRPQHAQFTILENGQIQVELTNPEAHGQTLINGKTLPKEKMVQILCHLDKLYLGSGAMLLFKYPLLNKKM